MKINIFKNVSKCYPTLKTRNFFSIGPILIILDVPKSPGSVFFYNRIYFPGRFHESSSNLRYDLLPEGLLCGTRLNFDVRPSVLRTPSVLRPSGYFGSFMLVDRHRRQDFWTHMFKLNPKRRKNCQKKTEFKQERNDRPKSVFENFLKNFPQAMDARKYRIVFYWIHMFGVKPPKNQHFQPENTSNTSD